MSGKSNTFGITVFVVFCLIFLPLMGIGDDIHQKVKKAKAELQKGINSWSVEKMMTAKDMFLNLLLAEEDEGEHVTTDEFNIFIAYNESTSTITINTISFLLGLAIPIVWRKKVTKIR